MNAERNTYLRERWKTKSKKYPRYSSPSGDIREEILKTVKEAGVDFTGKSVLDIGCGTGVYTICVAKEAKSVTGVDISESMLNILREDSAAEGCSNIEIINCPWDVYDSDGRMWDIVFSTMSPALDVEADFKKASSLAGEAVVYLGWGGKRENGFVNCIVEKYGLNPRDFRNSIQMKEWLDKENISYFSKVFDEERIKEISQEEAMEYCIDECQNYRIDVTEEMISSCLPEYTDKDGRVRFVITSQLELIIWKK